MQASDLSQDSMPQIPKQKQKEMQIRMQCVEMTGISCWVQSDVFPLRGYQCLTLSK